MFLRYSSDQLKRVGQLITSPVSHACYKRLRQINILKADHRTCRAIKFLNREASTFQIYQLFLRFILVLFYHLLDLQF